MGHLVSPHLSRNLKTGLGEEKVKGRPKTEGKEGEGGREKEELEFACAID